MTGLPTCPISITGKSKSDSVQRVGHGSRGVAASRELFLALDSLNDVVGCHRLECLVRNAMTSVPTTSTTHTTIDVRGKNHKQAMPTAANTAILR